MTTILHTTGLVDHSRRNYDTPDLSGDLFLAFNNISSAVDDIEFSTEESDESTFNKAVNNVHSELSRVKDIGKGSDLEDFMEYTTNLERLVDSLTGSLLSLTWKLERMDKEICEGKIFDREKLSDFLCTLRDEAVENLGCDQSLRYTLESRRWTKRNIEYLFRILDNPQVYLEIIAKKSNPGDMIVGIDGWLYVSDSMVHIVNGQDDIKLNQKNGDLEIFTCIKGKTQSFKLHDMKDMFMDILNPTDDEILMYEMASQKVYDIYAWCEIFGSKPK